MIRPVAYEGVLEVLLGATQRHTHRLRLCMESAESGLEGLGIVVLPLDQGLAGDVILA